MTFDEIYIKNYKELRRFGRQLNVSPETIEDLLHDTFLRFYIELEKETVFDNPRAWLYKVFLNLYKSAVISRRLETENPGTRSGSVQAADFNEEYTKNEKQRIVFEVLDQLEKRDKEILMLYHNGFSYAEMAGILEINPNSVGKTLVRAIEKLRQSLKVQYHEMFEQS